MPDTPLVRSTFVTLCVTTTLCVNSAHSEAPPFTDYCKRLQQEIQGKKHGFLAGNVTYYVGGFHASWNLKEHETLGLTHPFHHDLRSRGVGLVQSGAEGDDDTGLGNDFSGWEFYKDTRVLYGSVVVDGESYRHPIPTKMFWRPDRMICEYEVAGVRLRETKFIAANDAACSVIVASRPVLLRFEGQSFYGRNSLTSTASIEYDANHNAIQIKEGGTTRCRPETDRSDKVGPIMYQGMSTVLTASSSLVDSHDFTRGDNGEWKYRIETPCDREGVVLVWAMDDERDRAINAAAEVLRDPRAALRAKTRETNRQLNEDVPWFRCSDGKHVDIYYYLWALYLMYYIDVQQGWEMEPHTQTAVNNFLGMHRYDATFQIKVGAWTGDKARYAYGNVLTWKHLLSNGQYRQGPNGEIAISDNKGTTWHSGVYGNELSEHVLGAWQIYQHTGDLVFLRDCYEGFYREAFRKRIVSFFSNHFEVIEALTAMARLTGHGDDVARWERLVPLDSEHVSNWFKNRWEANGHESFFGGAEDGMLMTTGFWHMRSRYFPRSYAMQMTEAWALDREKGFYGDFFPLAMSRQAMGRFATDVDHSFGYTPDTAYFTLSGMFRQRLGLPACQLTLNHLENYNYRSEWGVPVAPEAYTRSAELFGDQYSNFNAGKLLLYLEGLAGLEYSIPKRSLVVHDTMPTNWEWMEYRVPLQLPGEREPRWPVVRYERTTDEDTITKSIRVTDCPLQVTIEAWSEGKRVIRSDARSRSGRRATASGFRDYRKFAFKRNKSRALVELVLSAE